MNYLKEVLNYYLKNFLYIIVFCIIPVVFISLLLKPFSLFEFVVQYPNYTITNFSDFYLAVYGINWIDILWIVLSFIILVIAISLLLGFIESHFKTGKVSWINTFSLNSNVLSVFKIILILSIFAYAVNIIMMLLMFLVHFLCAVDGVGNVFSCIFNYVILFFGMFVIVRSFTMFTLTGIGMMINGSPMNVSFSDATHAVSRNAWKIFAVEVALFLIVFAIVVIFTILDLTWLGNILGLMLFLPIECILGMVVFFDYNDIKRYDKRRLFVKF